MRDKRGRYWRAVYALREAEALAKFGNVSGPADAPPKSEADEKGFITDWKNRAKQSLKQAYDWWTEGNSRLKDRAKEVAGKIAEGARAVRDANPIEAARQGIESLLDVANKIQGALLLGEGIGTLLLLWIVYELFLKKG